MRARLFPLALAASLLTACSTGPVKRVSPPQVSVAQLSVQADGQWQVDLRLQNFSSIGVQPTATGRLLAAGALADARALPYQLSGKLQASPVDGRSREYPITFRSSLHPAPGLSGVLR